MGKIENHDESRRESGAKCNLVGEMKGMMKIFIDRIELIEPDKHKEVVINGYKTLRSERG